MDPCGEAFSLAARRYDGYDEARGPSAVTPERVSDSQLGLSCFRRRYAADGIGAPSILLGTDYQKTRPVEILSRYPGRQMEIEMRENMWLIGAVKRNGVLVTLASGNIQRGEAVVSCQILVASRANSFRGST